MSVKGKVKNIVGKFNTVVQQRYHRSPKQSADNDITRLGKGKDKASKSNSDEEEEERIDDDERGPDNDPEEEEIRSRRLSPQRYSIITSEEQEQQQCSENEDDSDIEEVGSRKLSKEEEDQLTGAKPSPNKSRIDQLVDELIREEEIYITDLQVIITKYMPYIYDHRPQHLVGRSPYLFGNIEDIYKAEQNFLVILQRNRDSVDKLSSVFYESTFIFDLYIKYLRNKPKCDIFISQFNAVIKKAQKNFGDSRSLEEYLLAPWHRLAKYVVTLEQIQKELQKSKRKSDLVRSALGVVREAISKSNHFIAVDSIQFSKVDMEKQGAYVKRQSFKVLKPKKFDCMLFLFENAIILTEKDSHFIDKFVYKDCIELSDLTLGKLEERSRVFELIKHVRDKSKKLSTPYVLEADTPKTKHDWVATLEEKLWDQLKSVKASRVGVP